MGFLKVKIDEDSQWIGRQVKDLNLTFSIIVAKIMRDGKAIVPRGDTTLHAGDVIVLGGEEYFDPTGHDLVEHTICSGHAFIGRQLKNISLQPEHLIVMIRREDGEIIVPQGDTEIMEGDILVSMLHDGKPDSTIKDGCNSKI